MIRLGPSANADNEEELLYSIDKDTIRNTGQIAPEVGVSL